MKQRNAKTEAKEAGKNHPPPNRKGSKITIHCAGRIVPGVRHRFDQSFGPKNHHSLPNERWPRGGLAEISNRFSAKVSPATPTTNWCLFCFSFVLQTTPKPGPILRLTSYARQNIRTRLHSRACFTYGVHAPPKGEGGGG